MRDLGGADRTSSGPGLIGRIPGHWREGNIRRFALMRTGHTPSRSVDDYWVDCNIPWFTLADVWQLRDERTTYVSPQTNALISEAGLKHSAAELLPAGTVMLSRTASVGFTGIMPIPMATSQDYWNWVCGPQLLPEYLVAVFRAMRPELRSLMLGSTHQTIYQATAASIRIPVPPLVEQRAITDHLSRETAEIDTLIRKQDRLIDTLRERRRATAESLIDHPRVGDGARLKHYVQRVRQGWSPQCYTWPTDGIESWAVLKAGAPNGGVFRPQENKALPPEEAPRPETVVRAGQVLVSRASTRELVGSAAVVNGHYPRLMLSDKLYALEVDETRAVPNYIALMLSTRAWRDLIELEATGSSPSMQNISQADILNLPASLPPTAEQSRRLRTFDYQSAKVDALIAKAEQFIALARERRSALITAAVTGQIDVRTTS